jgi:hypothetical protein
MVKKKLSGLAKSNASDFFSYGKEKFQSMDNTKIGIERGNSY